MAAARGAFRETHTDIEVILSEIQGIEAIMSGLGRGEFDFAFALNPEPDERAEAIARLENPWVIPTRRDGPIGDVEHPSFELIDRTDVVVWTRRWIGQLDLEEAWRRRGIAPRIVYQTDDNLALQRLVAAGLGHACHRPASPPGGPPTVSHLARSARRPEHASDRVVLPAPPPDHRRRVRVDISYPSPLDGLSPPLGSPLR